MSVRAACLGVALLIPAGRAIAEQPTPLGLEEGLYVAPMHSYTTVDVARQTADGDGQIVAAGYRWEFAAVELRYGRLELPRSDGTGTAEVTSTLMGVQLAPLQKLRIVTNVYAALNLGRAQRVDHPGFARDGDSDVVEAGLGNLAPFELFGLGFAVRLEALYRLETAEPPHADSEPRKFEDYVFHVGLQARLAGRRGAPPAVSDRPAASTPLVDSDDDGVVDERDRCPGTAPGSFVDNTGCAPATQDPSAS